MLKINYEYLVIINCVHFTTDFKSINILFIQKKNCSLNIVIFLPFNIISIEYNMYLLINYILFNIIQLFIYVISLQLPLRIYYIITKPQHYKHLISLFGL